MTEPAINERAQYLLKALIERHIRDGQPVGSKTLAQDSGLDLSPATIRNVVADLERLGLVHAPHTSAGRVPTELGYRLFIDNLVSVKPLGEPEVQTIAEQLDAEVETSTLLENASAMLSGLTRMAGVVMLPFQKQEALRHIEFLPLSDNRVLAILVINERDVQNRVIQTSRSYSRVELERVANYLNTQFEGQNLSTVRRKLLDEMQGDREHIDRLMRSTIEIAQQAFEDDDAGTQDYVLAGETNLMGYEEMADVTRLRQLFEAFNEKRAMLDLFDKSLQAQGVQIFIGQESGYEVFDNCSVVTATYSSADDEVLGVLGVIGPTRMAYDRIIPVVDVTAKLLGHVLNPRN
ncbi:MAG TPA: heat-inducible transcription repressor HrcA [Gammaproteobacteria bacterium]|nr:heat-inducible transcription repressor HrcA [Gammaproteobacteria bacterium]